MYSPILSRNGTLAGIAYAVSLETLYSPSRYIIEIVTGSTSDQICFSLTPI